MSSLYAAAHYFFLHLGDIGKFLTGLAAFLALLFWRRGAKVDRLNLRATAAAVTLSQFRKCISQVEDIIYKYHFYQYPSFPEAEIAPDKEETPHRERPPRLLSLKIGQLIRDLQEPIAQISGKASYELLNSLVELEILGKSIGGAIYGELGGYTEEIRESQQNILCNAPTQLRSILQKVEKILLPIIELKENKTKQIIIISILIAFCLLFF